MVIYIRYLHISVPEYLLFFTFDQSLEQLADLVLTHLNTFFFFLRYVFMLFLYIRILSTFNLYHFILLNKYQVPRQNTNTKYSCSFISYFSHNVNCCPAKMFSMKNVA